MLVALCRKSETRTNWLAVLHAACRSQPHRLGWFLEMLSIRHENSLHQIYVRIRGWAEYAQDKCLSDEFGTAKQRKGNVDRVCGHRLSVIFAKFPSSATPVIFCGFSFTPLVVLLLHLESAFLNETSSEKATSYPCLTMVHVRRNKPYFSIRFIILSSVKLVWKVGQEDKLRVDS